VSAPTAYNPAVIQAFADRLYAQAERIVFVYGALGFIVGAAAGGAFGSTAADGVASILIAAAACGALMALLAATAGHARAFTLRLQAQTALCQVQIEANSRRQ
jgi:hypothetical protein